MRIQFASDLHLECLRGRPAGETLVSPQPDADLLVLAGDIDNGVAGVRQFATWPVPVLYVPGNHEAYEGVLDAVRAAIRQAARGTSVAGPRRRRGGFEPLRRMVGPASGRVAPPALAPRSRFAR